jgi:hypothetical protein
MREGGMVCGGWFMLLEENILKHAQTRKGEKERERR